MINYSYYLQQIENLFRLEPNPNNHNPETTEPHNIRRIRMAAIGSYIYPSKW